MNKKVMALAVAGAFATPAAALAQASNVQIFGTAYIEYGYFHQGARSALGTGDLVNIDLLQTPGSEIGIKGEEALGGGYAAWFQCASTMDLKGAGASAVLAGAAIAQPAGIFCGRNSAIGLKSAFGNVFAGNWDMPIKRTAGPARLVSDTGLWGVGPLLFGGSGSVIDNATPTQWSRRQNAAIFYDSPVWQGFQVFAGVSTPNTAATGAGATTNQSGAKPRVWGVAANYINGPLLLTAGWENHSNFSTGGAAIGNAAYSATDNAYNLGAAYQFGPVKAGLIYTRQAYDMGVVGGVANDATVTAWGIGAEWNIQGPHNLRAGYHKANNTSGSAGAAFGAAGTLVGNRIYNGGRGATGATIWQAQYVFNASKRTEFTAGYARLQNDANARYGLGGVTTPAAGQNQDAFGISWKHLF